MSRNHFIRDAETGDINAINDIWNHYVAHTTATYQEDLQTPSETEALIGRADHPSLVALTAEQKIVGYAYTTPFRSRGAYRHTCEVSVYVSPHHTGNGVGGALLRALIDRLREKHPSLHKAVAVISLPNPPSIALHEKCGFTHAGVLPGVGKKFGHWLDSGYWILSLRDNE